MMHEYVLIVYCRRGEVTRDSGEHDRFTTDDEQAANRRINGAIDGLKYHYDEIYATIQVDGETTKEYRAK